MTFNRITTETKSWSNCFIDYTLKYLCIIDIVNSIRATVKIINPQKRMKYYSIFLNTISSIIKDYGDKVRVAL